MVLLVPIRRLKLGDLAEVPLLTKLVSRPKMLTRTFSFM